MTELLAAEALGYAATSEKPRSRSTQSRTGSWWAWLSTAVLALVLLRVGIALHAARRFNRELAAHLGYLLGYLHYLPPAPEPLTAPPPAPAAQPTAPPPLVVAVAPPHQQQAQHELRQAAETALTDADFGPIQLAERLALGERTLYRHIK